jgi:polyisoprenoid-binding protein YceI
MNRIRKWVQLVAVVVLLAPATLAWAQWELDAAKSAVNFISVKNSSVAEVHSFKSLVGYIGADGKVRLTINLDSVETLVPIRNERMREMLFDTANFPAATIGASVDPAIIAAAAQGGTVTTELPISLSLHGIDRALTIPVVVVGEENGHLRVFTAKPVVLKAADFGLEAGVAALQKVAGLQSVSTAVPVTIHLVFVYAG